MAPAEKEVFANPSKALDILNDIDTLSLDGIEEKEKYAMLHSLTHELVHADSSTINAIESAYGYYKDHYPEKEKFRAAWFTALSTGLAFLISIIFVICTAVKSHRRYDKKREKMRAIVRKEMYQVQEEKELHKQELMDIKDELERKSEIIRRTHQLHQEELHKVHKDQMLNFGQHFKYLNLLWEILLDSDKKNSAAERHEYIYNKVSDIIIEASSEASIDRLEKDINSAMDNILENIRIDIPNLTKGEYDIFKYCVAGASTRQISDLFNYPSFNSVYIKKSRLKSKIMALSEENTRKRTYLMLLEGKTN